MAELLSLAQPELHPQEQAPRPGTGSSFLGTPRTDSCPLPHALGLTLEGSSGTLTSGLMSPRFCLDK